MNTERGGGPCTPPESGKRSVISAHVLKGSGHVGSCTPSISGGIPRWHDAEGVHSGTQLIGKGQASRHSAQAGQVTRGAAGSAYRAQARTGQRRG